MLLYAHMVATAFLVFYRFKAMTREETERAKMD